MKQVELKSAEFVTRNDRNVAQVDDLASFETIASIAHKEAGLVLAADKMPMVLARVAKRMRILGLNDLASYSRYISSDAGADERREMIYSLTTNVTSFLREAHHFDFLKKNLIQIFAENGRKGRRTRIWSAGCSTGQEPYTIAMALLDEIPLAAELDIRILATDIDPHVLAVARAGQYPANALEPLPATWKKKFTDEPNPLQADASAVISDKVKALISFRELNLLGEWPMQGPFDLIFCRNVVIYFDSDTQAKLWKRFRSLLKVGGHICIGHSERIDPESLKGFQAVATTIYEKREDSVFSPAGG